MGDDTGYREAGTFVGWEPRDPLHKHVGRVSRVFVDEAGRAARVEGALGPFGIRTPRAIGSRSRELLRTPFGRSPEDAYANSSRRRASGARRYGARPNGSPAAASGKRHPSTASAPATSSAHTASS